MIQITITNNQPTLVEISKDYVGAGGSYKLVLINGLSNQKFEANDLVDEGNGYVFKFNIDFGTEIRNGGQWNAVLYDVEGTMLVNDIANIELQRTDDPDDIESDDIYYEADEVIRFIPGPPGPQGPAGPQGPQGEQGPQGPAGPQGTQGTQGTPGTNGQNGITPHIDETTGNWFIGTDDTGVHAQGPQGTQGIQGPQGEQGPQGTQGIQGTQGPQGEQGPAGPQGTQGTPGTNGQDGITPHIDETTKHWMIGSTDTGVVAEGQQGPQGTQGIQGPEGPQGPAGPQGTQGTAGTPGSDGQDGITPHIDSTTGNWFIGSTDTGVHAQGPQGTQGIQGTQGPQGEQGTAGTNGQDGITPHIDSTTGNWFIGSTDTGVHAEGPQGPQGTQGIQGTQGPQGTAGTNGQDGITPHIDSSTNHWMLGTTDTGVNATGPQGPQGTQGIQGTQGPQGTAGETAWVGTQQAYDNLPSHEQNKLYCITDGSPINQEQADWNQSNSSAVDYIKNKPTIPAAPVQSNWNETDTDSLAYIQNKPSIPSGNFETWTFALADGTTTTKTVYVQ